MDCSKILSELSEEYERSMILLAQLEQSFPIQTREPEDAVIGEKLAVAACKPHAIKAKFTRFILNNKPRSRPWSSAPGDGDSDSDMPADKVVNRSHSVANIQRNDDHICDSPFSSDEIVGRVLSYHPQTRRFLQPTVIFNRQEGRAPPQPRHQQEQLQPNEGSGRGDRRRISGGSLGSLLPGLTRRASSSSSQAQPDLARRSPAHPAAVTANITITTTTTTSNNNNNNTNPSPDDQPLALTGLPLLPSASCRAQPSLLPPLLCTRSETQFRVPHEFAAWTSSGGDGASAATRTPPLGTAQVDAAAMLGIGPTLRRSTASGGGAAATASVAVALPLVPGIPRGHEDLRDRHRVASGAGSAKQLLQLQRHGHGHGHGPLSSPQQQQEAGTVATVVGIRLSADPQQAASAGSATATAAAVRGGGGSGNLMPPAGALMLPPMLPAVHQGRRRRFTDSATHLFTAVSKA